MYLQLGTNEDEASLGTPGLNGDFGFPQEYESIEKLLKWIEADLRNNPRLWNGTDRVLTVSLQHFRANFDGTVA